MKCKNMRDHEKNKLLYRLGELSWLQIRIKERKLILQICHSGLQVGRAKSMRNAEPFEWHPFCAQESYSEERTVLFLTIKAPV